MKISSVYKIPADKYNQQLASALKQIPEFKEPEWAMFVKTGVAKIKPPQEKDFWYKRAASILRQIYIHKIVGVSKLRTRYGSKKNRGMRPEKFRKASGKIIRTILQQAEAAGLLEKQIEPGKRAGRKLTSNGKEFLEGIKERKEESTPKIEIKENKIEKIEKIEKELAKEIAETEEKVEEHEITQKQADEEIKQEVKDDLSSLEKKTSSNKEETRLEKLKGGLKEKIDVS